MTNILETIRQVTYQIWIDRAEQNAKKMLKKVIDDKYSEMNSDTRERLYKKYTNIEYLYKTSEFPYTKTDVIDPGSFNAFTHAYTTAKMSRNPFNLAWTTTSAFIKEAVNYPNDWKDFFSKNTPLINLNDLDHNRDWYNNFYGMKKGAGKIGWSDKQIARLIFDGMENGELITSAKDPQNRLSPYYKLKNKIEGKSIYDTVEERELQYYYNKPSNFKSLNIEKQLSIKNPVVQGISGTQSDYTPMQITYPAIKINPSTSSWLWKLGDALSTVGKLAGAVAGATGGKINATKSVSAIMKPDYYDYSDQIIVPQFNDPVIHHTGGKISGKDEVLAILRGGETVRTEAQERELQEEKYKELINFIGPMLQKKEQKPKTIAEAYDPNNKIPCLLNKTTQDEEIIISIIAQAWKSNRLGFRNVLRYE